MQDLDMTEASEARIITFLELSFPGAGEQIMSFLRPFRDWEPRLMPQRDQLEDRLSSCLDGLGYLKTWILSREELAQILVTENRENEKLRRRVQGLPIDDDEPVDPAGEERLIQQMASSMLAESPRQACHPMRVTPLDVSLREAIFPCRLGSLQQRELRAALSFLFWWKYRSRIPGVVRDLLWGALYAGCSGTLLLDGSMTKRAWELAMLLLEGNWPIALDTEKRLIVLVEK